jgi:RNA polymerase sigma factor (sigma-70 family)
MSTATRNDAELVGESLSGNRDAFGQIVSRYQSLVCSLAYSATGSLSQSEDLAQETFVAAWKQLADLREPGKLRAWLCGITRNLIHNSLRRQGREPSYAAESLDLIHEAPAPEPLPSDYAINREEEAILWRSLERIPEIYREPLVLFYREHQSVEAVAQNLELSEDAVKQRLSRGRKMLQEQVLTFVEGALEKTSPGKTFTLGVLAALPVTATTAKAATIGAAFAKGAAAAKSAAMVGSLGGLFATLGGAFITLRAQADDTKSPRERQFVLQMIGIRLIAILLFGAVCFGIGKFDFFLAPVTREILKAAYIFSICVLGMGFFIYSSRRQCQIQIEEKTFVEAEWTMPRRNTDSVTNLLGAKSNTNLKAVKFRALGLVLSAIIIFQAPWKQHLGHAILFSAGCALALFWSYRSWQNRPRYQSLRSGWVVVFPIMMGLMTLFFSTSTNTGRKQVRTFQASHRRQSLLFSTSLWSWPMPCSPESWSGNANAVHHPEKFVIFPNLLA